MGALNSERLDFKKDLQSTEFDPPKSLELPERRQIQAEEKEDRTAEKEEESKNSMPVFGLQFTIPSLGEFKVKEEEDNNNCGFRTPTSLDQRIPFSLPCPPAPRKPRSLPLKKRKAAPRDQMILLDLSNEEVESLFPPAILVNFGRKIKKVRRVNYCS